MSSIRIDMKFRKKNKISISHLRLDSSGLKLIHQLLSQSFDQCSLWCSSTEEDLTGTENQSWTLTKTRTTGTLMSCEDTDL